MLQTPAGACMVAFVSVRGDEHWDEEYRRHSSNLAEIIGEQPGFIDFISVRDPETRVGVTLAVFADEAAALAWKQVGEHRLAQDFGRASGYGNYRVIVTQVSRSYGP